MSKGQTLHRTYRFLCFVFALSWVVQRDLYGDVFSTVEVCLCSRREWDRVPAGVRRQFSVCNWTWSLLSMVEGPVFQAESPPHLHAQGFPSSCRHRDVAIFLLGFAITWPEPIYTGFIWYYFLICYNGDLNTLQFIKHCQWFSIKKRGRNSESLNTFCFPLNAPPCHAVCLLLWVWQLYEQKQPDLIWQPQMGKSATNLII